MSCKRKIPLGENVLDAAQKRIEWLFDTFEQITLSFSGGKDSTVLFHLVAAEARRRHRKFNVMFLDWEVQYSATISHVAAMKSLYADCTQRFYWIALPVTTESGISQYEPAWTAWEPVKNGSGNHRKMPLLTLISFPSIIQGLFLKILLPHLISGSPEIITALSYCWGSAPMNH